MSQEPLPETQHQRWLKYGLNVAVMTIVVVALGVCLIYLTQKTKKRVDTTGAGVYSLKPQTKNIVKDLKTPVKLVSLYSRSVSAEDRGVDETRTTNPEDFVGPVEDLLAEYKSASNQIEVEFIDPVASPTKVDDLIVTVTNKYGGEVKKYQDFVKNFVPRYDNFRKSLTDESAVIEKLPLDQIKTRDLYMTVALAVGTVRDEMPTQLDKAKDRIDRLNKQKPPDYKGVTDYISQTMSVMSALLDGVIGRFESSQQNPQVPEDIRKYMADALPRYKELKKTADAFVTEIGGLGELKLDTLRQSLREKDSILVLGETELKVIPRSQVWQRPNTGAFSRNGEAAKPVFAGEQQVTSAILSLTMAKRPTVAVLRAGGPPVTDPNPFVRQQLTLGIVAERLTAMGFKVLEKDYTGQWAMQSQMQGMPAAPEPTDEELKDAIWIVLNTPAGQSPMGMPPPSAAAKLAEHLSNGGSALVLAEVSSDNLTAALDPWGVQLKTDLLACKPAIKSGNDREGDIIDQAERSQYIYILNNFGDHLLAKAANSLDAVFAPLTPVVTTKKDGYTTSGLVPLAETVWGEQDYRALFQGDEAKLDTAKGDLAGPLFGGAAVEKTGGGRLVVFGSAGLPADVLLQFPDPDLLKQKKFVPRFPGNSELFMNSVFWLAKMEPMIAISPAAMQVSRIAPMSEGTVRAWNLGVLLGLPGLIVLGGVLMYLSRRD